MVESKNGVKDVLNKYPLSDKDYQFLVEFMFSLRQYIVNKEYKTIKKVTDLYQSKDRDILNASLDQLSLIGRPMSQMDVKFVIKFLKHVRNLMFFANDYTLEHF